MRKFLLLLLGALFATSVVFAQTESLSGKVLDEQGVPVPYASIKIKGSSAGTSAAQDGTFKIKAKVGDVLVISTVGFQDKEVTVPSGTTTITVVLKKSTTELAEVVVGALGIKRSVKATTYAAQQITSDRLTQARETDLTSALAGKASGVQVLGQSGSKLGDVGVVRLRGSASIKDVYAIYVVDGTILTNVTDINMDDVESVSVLKGPNATALYGQRAEGGVIVITTKKGNKKKKIQVDFNQTTLLDKVNVVTDYQNLYGGGNSSAWKTYTYTPGTSPAEWAALNGKKYHNYSTDESWGPRIDGSEYIPWYAWYPGSNYSFKTANYTAQPDNVKDFFKTGLTLNNNISVSGGGDKYSARVSYTNIDRTGILPESKQTKHTFSTQLSYDITSKLSATTNLTYAFEDIKGDFNDGYSNFTAGSFNQWFHRDLDMGIMKELAGLKTPMGYYASWNHSDPSATSNYNTYAVNSSYFWYNPYSWMQNNKVTNHRTRFFGDVGLKYKILKDWDVSANYRFNKRKTEAEEKTPQILQDGGYQTGVYAGYSLTNTDYFEQNIELLTTYKKKLNNFNFDLAAGANFMKWKQRDSSRATDGGLVIPDLFTIANSVTQPPVLAAGYSDKEVLSFFGKATIGYKDFLFADVTLRQDYSSVLPKDNNGYLTPSVGASFIFSDFTKKIIPSLSFGKLRASYARIGTDNLNPYEINLVYTTSNAAYNNQFHSTAVPNLLVDPNIRPTINTAYETGLDLKFFKNRLGFSGTYFYEVKKDDIVTTDISTASGYTQKKFNVGKVTRQGIELQLEAKPIKTRNFSWDVTFNWSAVRSVVNEVSDQTKTINLNAPGFNARGLQFGNPVSLTLPSVVHVEGETWGQLRGYGIKKINGVPVIDANGLYVEEANVNFGSVLPNYTGGIFNQFTYKNVSLSFSIDFQQGGKFFSLSDWFGTYTGLMARTAALNDNGVNVRESLSSGGGVHVYGVDESGKPLDMYVDAKTYFKQFSDNSSGISDLSVFDATYVKLREVSLGYNFNLKNTKIIKRAFVSLVAKSPWIIYKTNPTVDPSELSDRNGEQGQLPGTRSLGLNIKLSF